MFDQYVVEPFIETKGWVRDNWGRIVVEHTLVDLVADKRFDFPAHTYEPYVWRGITLWLEPFMTRYKTEKERDREDRVEAFTRFLSQRGLPTLTYE